MTYVVSPDSPKGAAAAAFGRELMRAIAARGIGKNELWRSTGIGRTALDNYRTGSSLPKTEAAATLAASLDWPKLLEIVETARTRSCRRCGRAFRNDGGNMGAKRYCSVSCREIATQEKQASTRIRQAGQTDDGRRRYQAVALLRSGIRIAEERTAELQAAVDAMCGECEPAGVCREAMCPLRACSPLPLAIHEVDQPRTADQVRAAFVAKRWTPERRAEHGAITAGLHAAGRIPYLPKGDARHPANDPARREGWIAAQRAGHAGRKPRTLTPEHRAAIAAGHARRREAAVA